MNLDNETQIQIELLATQSFIIATGVISQSLGTS